MQVRRIGSTLLALICLMICLGCDQGRDSKLEERRARLGKEQPLRVGWLASVPIHAQVIQALKHTSILEQHGIIASFHSFSFGSPEVEAALAGELDVLFVGDQPFVNLYAKDPAWKIVGRMMYGRVTLMVPNQSPIKTIADLRGKRVASAFGSVAHRDVVLWQQAAGLDPRKDVTNINLDILEILNLVQRGGDWGGLDAAMTWDPGAAIIEVKDGARVIKQARVTMVISMPQRLLDQSPQLARRFLSAVRDGWAYYATHQKQANAWYEAEVRKQFGDEILQRVAASEPNMQARNSDEVDLSFSSDDLKSLQTSADWALEMGLATSKMDMSSSIDLRFLERDTRETVG